ncbi:MULTISPECIES: hypothetical protein [unclassified Sphingopyxis]|uniref:hypothetical protein n=1 Tax=unclassified Sphingopyxis TaxID=2614943 RepID=UPI0012E35C26|nr:MULTISPECIES: hypothetical protein [unclassified Sphingopyxis]
MTAIEAIATIERSSLLTVILEGQGDYFTFARIEAELSEQGISFMPLCGRDLVLEVISSLSPEALSRCLAIVDLDTWVYSRIPDEVIGDNVLFTLGYSIENDVILNSDLYSLMTGNERASFLAELKIVVNWYASELEDSLNGLDTQLSRHPNNILQSHAVCGLANRKKFWEDTIGSKYDQLLRGKTLLALLVRQLSSKNRASRYSKSNLMEIGVLQAVEWRESVKRSLMDRFSMVVAGRL